MTQAPLGYTGFETTAINPMLVLWSKSEKADALTSSADGKSRTSRSKSSRFSKEQAQPDPTCKRWHINVVLRFGSFWIGCHFSRKHKSICIAPVPCVVIRIARTPYTTPEPGGIVL